MIKQFNFNGKIEEYDVDYMVLFGERDNEHPEDHYTNRKNNGMVFDTLVEAKDSADEKWNARIWEVAHAIDSGDIVFVTEVK
jgi:hypothetical protein